MKIIRYTKVLVEFRDQYDLVSIKLYIITKCCDKLNEPPHDKTNKMASAQSESLRRPHEETLGP